MSVVLEEEIDRARRELQDMESQTLESPVHRAANDI
jgi:hypothetical protein